MRAISPLTMIPVGANGDSDPAFAPLPTMIAIRKSGMFAFIAVVIAIGATSAAVEMLPGPIDASAAAEHEIHDRHDAAMAATDPHRVVRDPVERPVALRHREQQRHAGQRQEQRARKAAHHRRRPASRRCRRRRSTRARSRSTPTLIVVTQLRMIARASAATEIQARFISAFSFSQHLAVNIQAFSMSAVSRRQSTVIEGRHCSCRLATRPPTGHCRLRWGSIQRCECFSPLTARAATCSR